VFQKDETEYGALVFTGKKLHVWKPEVFGWIPALIYATPFMLMVFYLLCFCIALQVSLTLLRPKLAAEDPQKLFWAHLFDAHKARGWPGLANDKVLTALVFVAMCVLHYMFL